jgi:mono/diheme cytochrome c family protein
MTLSRSESLSPRQRAWQFCLRSLPLIAAVCFAVSHATDVHAGDRQRNRGDELHPDLIFHNYCSVCHGDRGDGRSRAANSLMPPPKDFTSAATIAELGRARMVTSVTYGRPGTAMAAWRAQLSEREIEAVVDYIRTTIMEPNSKLAGGRGEAIYAAHCASCHGPTGRGVLDHATGARRAPDLATPEASQNVSRSRMIDAVVNGKSGTMMIDYGQKLAMTDIEAVVDYMRTAFMLPVIDGLSGIKARGESAAAEKPKPSVDMDAPMPKNLQGDSLKGQAFFLGNCATCHGFQGDGKGPRAYFINPRPRDFLEAASRARLNRPALFEAISNGRFGAEMPAWSKVLSEAEIADVAEFVFQEFIRPKKAAQEAAAAK